MRQVLEYIGESLNTPCNYGQMPSTPDDVTLLNIYGGINPDLELGSFSPMIRYPSLQLMIRRKEYQSALDDIEAYNAVIPTIVGGDDFSILQIKQRSDILFLGRDKDDRYLFSVNYTIVLDNTH